VIKRSWTSRWLLKLGSYHANGWRDGAGTEADPGVGSGDCRLISFLSISVLVCLCVSFHLPVGLKGRGGELCDRAG